MTSNILAQEIDLADLITLRFTPGVQMYFQIEDRQVRVRFDSGQFVIFYRRDGYGYHTPSKNIINAFEAHETDEVIAAVNGFLMDRTLEQFLARQAGLK